MTPPEKQTRLFVLTIYKLIDHMFVVRLVEDK